MFLTSGVPTKDCPKLPVADTHEAFRWITEMQNQDFTGAILLDEMKVPVYYWERPEKSRMIPTARPLGRAFEILRASA